MAVNNQSYIDLVLRGRFGDKISKPFNKAIKGMNKDIDELNKKLKNIWKSNWGKWWVELKISGWNLKENNSNSSNNKSFWKGIGLGIKSVVGWMFIAWITKLWKMLFSNVLKHMELYRELSNENKKIVDQLTQQNVDKYKNLVISKSAMLNKQGYNKDFINLLSEQLDFRSELWNQKVNNSIEDLINRWLVTSRAEALEKLTNILEQKGGFSEDLTKLSHKSLANGGVEVLKRLKDLELVTWKDYSTAEGVKEYLKIMKEFNDGVSPKNLEDLKEIGNKYQGYINQISKGKRSKDEIDEIITKYNKSWKKYFWTSENYLSFLISNEEIKIDEVENLVEANSMFEKTVSSENWIAELKKLYTKAWKTQKDFKADLWKSEFERFARVMDVLWDVINNTKVNVEGYNEEFIKMFLDSEMGMFYWWDYKSISKTAKRIMLWKANNNFSNKTNQQLAKRNSQSIGWINKYLWIDKYGYVSKEKYEHLLSSKQDQEELYKRSYYSKDLEEKIKDADGRFYIRGGEFEKNKFRDAQDFIDRYWNIENMKSYQTMRKILMEAVKVNESWEIMGINESRLNDIVKMEKLSIKENNSWDLLKIVSSYVWAAGEKLTIGQLKSLKESIAWTYSDPMSLFKEAIQWAKNKGVTSIDWLTDEVFKYMMGVGINWNLDHIWEKRFDSQNIQNRIGGVLWSWRFVNDPFTKTMREQELNRNAMNKLSDVIEINTKAILETWKSKPWEVEVLKKQSNKILNDKIKVKKTDASIKDLFQQ